VLFLLITASLVEFASESQLMDFSSGSKLPSELWKLWCRLIYAKKTVEREPRSAYDKFIPAVITTGALMIFVGTMYASGAENHGGPPPPYHETMFHKRIGIGILPARAALATVGPAVLMFMKYRANSRSGSDGQSE